MNRVCILALICLFLVTPVCAETKPLADLLNEANTQLKAGKLGAFSELVDPLKEGRSQNGHSNLSSLSLLLLEMGEKNCAGSKEICSFLVKHALDLSPSDPNISFEAAWLTSSVVERFKLLGRTLSNLSNSPILRTRAITLGALVILSLFTVIFGTHCLVSISAIKYTGFFKSSFGALIFPLLCFVGLPFGILPTLLCWSLLAAMSKKERRFLVIFFAISLAWVLLLPICETVFKNLRRGLEQDLEIALSRISSPYFPNIEESSDLFVQLSMGTAEFEAKDYKKARERFEVVAKISPDHRVRRVAHARLGAVQLALREFDAAETSLRQAMADGGESFEILQNLALVAAGKLDLDTQRAYHERLEDLDHGRFVRESVHMAILLEPLSSGAFWDRYLEPPERLDNVMPSPPKWLANEEIVQPLIIAGGSQGLGAIILLSVLFSFLPVRRFV